MRIPYISLVAAGALALGGCSGLGVGLGYGSPYYGYGYGSPYSYGYGSSPYYGSYGSPYFGIGYGSRYYDPWFGGYGSPYYGWYNNYYYPGTGYYVYDTYRRAYPMTTEQRRYWSSRSPALKTGTTTTTTTRVRPNWSGFDRRSTANYTQRQAVRQERQVARQQRQATRTERQQTREERRKQRRDD